MWSLICPLAVIMVWGTGLDLDLISEHASNIKINYLSAMMQLIEHLYHLGHRSIAYVGGRPRLRNVKSRHEGYIRAMAALDPPDRLQSVSPDPHFHPMAAARLVVRGAS
jgi:DNA-binding LacI/PurR family transcriptional regulator